MATSASFDMLNDLVNDVLPLDQWRVLKWRQTRSWVCNRHLDAFNFCRESLQTPVLGDEERFFHPVLPHSPFHLLGHDLVASHVTIGRVENYSRLSVHPSITELFGGLAEIILDIVKLVAWLHAFVAGIRALDLPPLTVDSKSMS